MKSAYSALFAAIAALSALLVALPASSGTYDGVWTSPFVPGEYLIVRHPNESGTIGLAQLSTDGVWDASLGTISGNLASFDGLSLLGGADIVGTIEFSSPDVGSLTVIECVPLALECDIPLNVPIPIQKIL
jgi:hypothetical protein